MATYTAESNSYEGRKLRLEITQTKDIASNKSILNWTLYSEGGSSNYYSIYETIVNINNTQVYYKDYTNWDARIFPAAKGSVSGSIEIAHDNSGNATIPIYFQTGVYWSSAKKNYGSNFTLDKIDRGAIITAADNFTDEGNPTITYSNPAGNQVESLKACIANVGGSILYANYRDIDKNGTSYTFELTEQERENLRWATINSNTLTVRFYITSVVNGNTIYSTMDKILTIVNATPTFSSSVNDTGGASTALTGSNAGAVRMIKGFNYMVAKMIPTAYKGATITRCKITNGSNTVEAQEAVFNNSESNLFTFECWDSRGNYNSRLTTIEMANYFKPTCNADAAIELNTDSAAANIILKVNGNCFSGSFGAVNNELTIDYTVTTANGDVARTGEEIIALSGNTYNETIIIEGLDYREAYIVYVKAIDKINSVEAYTKMLKTFPLFDWSAYDFNFNIPVTIDGNLVVSNQVSIGGELVVGGQPLTDFIVSQGKISGWNYRIWKSGTAECWTITAPQTIHIGTAWGSMYVQDAAFPPYSYPFEFEEIPCVTFTPLCDSGNFWVFTNGGVGGTTTETQALGVCRPTQYGTNGARLNIQVKGKFKRWI